MCVLWVPLAGKVRGMKAGYHKVMKMKMQMLEFNAGGKASLSKKRRMQKSRRGWKEKNHENVV